MPAFYLATISFIDRGSACCALSSSAESRPQQISWLWKMISSEVNSTSERSLVRAFSAGRLGTRRSKLLQNVMYPVEASCPYASESTRHSNNPQHLGTVTSFTG